MKRIFLAVFSAVLVLALCGCGDPDYAVDSFYPSDMLESYGLSGLPAPKLENSRMYGEYLYCNLTQEEYERYVTEVITYLQTLENAHHLCYYHSGTMMFGVFPDRTFAPVREDYDLSGSHEFAYITAETMEYNAPLSSIRVKILRETDTLGRTGFTYNTCIRIDNDAILGTFDPCAESHTYTAGERYPIPGYEMSITYYECIYCYIQEQDHFPDLDFYTEYTVTVTEGQNYIFGNNQNYFPWGISSMYAGVALEIICNIPKEGQLQLLVNGEQIPVLRTTEDQVTFGFIMPDRDVEIRILLLTDEETSH